MKHYFPVFPHVVPYTLPYHGVCHNKSDVRVFSLCDSMIYVYSHNFITLVADYVLNAK